MFSGGQRVCGSCGHRGRQAWTGNLAEGRKPEEPLVVAPMGGKSKILARVCMQGEEELKLLLRVAQVILCCYTLIMAHPFALHDTSIHFCVIKYAPNVI